MTREIALHCMKSYSELHSDLCELCPIYGQTGSDHCFEDALEYVIKALEQDSKTVTVKQLEELYDKFQKELWREQEDVRGDDMIEVGYAEQFLQELLMEFGCWDREVEE